jgi:radical SAM protein with 4Fe4S-binding SPASM domain
MIDASFIPKLSPDLFFVNKEGKYLFLNTVVPDWIVVNQNAAYILSQCDGAKSIAAIVEQIRSEGHELDTESTVALFRRGAKRSILKNGNGRKKTANSVTVKCGAAPKPLHSVHLKLTDNCNLTCTYCYAESGARSSSPVLSLEELKRIADEIREFSGPVSYTLSGGEPLMHPDALELAEYLVAQGNSCALLTNGVPVNRKNAKKIAKLFDLIKISLDGSSEEVNSKTRGFNSFRAVMKAYRLLIDNGANVIINMTVCKSNISDIQNMLGLFGSRLSFQPLFKAGREREQSGNEVTGHEYYTALASVEGVKPMARIEDTLARLRGTGSEKCPLADGEISISETGNVYPCQMLYEEQFCGGNALESPIGDIYRNSAAFKPLRSLTIDSVLGCSSCPIRRLCGGACRARAYYETGDISASDNFCEYERHAYINGILDSSTLE